MVGCGCVRVRVHVCVCLCVRICVYLQMCWVGAPMTYIINFVIVV